MCTLLALCMRCRKCKQNVQTTSDHLAGVWMSGVGVGGVVAREDGGNNDDNENTVWTI